VAAATPTSRTAPAVAGHRRIRPVGSVEVGHYGLGNVVVGWRAGPLRLHHVEYPEIAVIDVSIPSSPTYVGSWGWMWPVSSVSRCRESTPTWWSISRRVRDYWPPKGSQCDTPPSRSRGDLAFHGILLRLRSRFRATLPTSWARTGRPGRIAGDRRIRWLGAGGGCFSNMPGYHKTLQWPAHTPSGGQPGLVS